MLSFREDFPSRNNIILTTETYLSYTHLERRIIHFPVVQSPITGKTSEVSLSAFKRRSVSFTKKSIRKRNHYLLVFIIPIRYGLGGQVRELIRVSVGLRHVVVVRNDVHAGHLVLLLPLHATVLEPDFDLALRQAERVRYFNPPPPRQVTVEVELLFQFQCLVPSVRSPLAFCFSVGVHCTCNNESTSSLHCQRLSLSNTSEIY